MRESEENAEPLDIFMVEVRGVPLRLRNAGRCARDAWDRRRPCVGSGGRRNFEKNWGEYIVSKQDILVFEFHEHSERRVFIKKVFWNL